MPTFHGANNANNIGSTLAVGITAIAVPPFDITVATGDGALFSPIPTPFYLTVALAAETETGVTSVIEIFNVTTVVGDLLTVDTRGISNTTAAAWSIGDKAQVRPVDLQLKELGDEINNIEAGGILTNASINAAAAIATTKLADGADFLQRDGSVVVTGNIDFGGFLAENAADPVNPQDLTTLAYTDATYIKEDGTTPFSGNQSMGSNKITSLANGTASTDAINLGQQNTAFGAFTDKNAALYTTTANVNLTGTATQVGGDWPGAMTAGDRVLVKDQTSPIENGIYLAAAGAWARATDADSDADFANGLVTYVRAGATLGDTLWGLTTNPPITLGVTNLSFSRISPTGAIGAQTTMSLGSDATGDVYYRNSSGYLARLAVGGVGEVLTVAAGLPSWASLTGSISISDPIASSTAGSILFAGAASDLQQDNANLFWDNTNNRLGIGTAAPATVGHLLLSDAATNSIVNALTIGHATSGTAAAGLGTGILLQVESDGPGKHVSAGRVAAALTSAVATAEASDLHFDTTLAGALTNKLKLTSAGNLALQLAGTSFRVKEGANCCMGTANLVGGTVTVNTTAVGSNSRIFLTTQAPGGTPGWLQVSARVASTSFTILSSDVADTSAVAWLILEAS